MNDPTLATKADLDALVTKLTRAIQTLEKTVLKEITASEKRMEHNLGLAVEQIMKDFRGVFNDRTVDLTTARQDHERRIQALEQHVGLIR